MVQPIKKYNLPVIRFQFKYISCYGSTKANISRSYLADVFKYISCYGSTKVS